jgi:hypothetical protein
MTDYTNTYPDLVNVEDWLNAKGYTGEAGACHQAMSFIRKQEKRIAELEAEIEKLKAALKPFASLLNDEGDYIVGSPSLSDLRAARAAYLGEKNEWFWLRKRTAFDGGTPSGA